MSLTLKPWQQRRTLINRNSAGWKGTCPRPVLAWQRSFFFFLLAAGFVKRWWMIYFICKRGKACLWNSEWFFYIHPAINHEPIVQTPHLVGCALMPGMSQAGFNFLSGFSVAASSSLFPPSAPSEGWITNDKSVFCIQSPPNTIPTPAVMRSLLCISQISRGMSLKAYTFNWLRQAGSHGAS